MGSFDKVLTWWSYSDFLLIVTDILMENSIISASSLPVVAIEILTIPRSLFVLDCCFHVHISISRILTQVLVCKKGGRYPMNQDSLPSLLASVNRENNFESALCKRDLNTSKKATIYTPPMERKALDILHLKNEYTLQQLSHFPTLLYSLLKPSTSIPSFSC